jgi:hypothetical protein
MKKPSRRPAMVMSIGSRSRMCPNRGLTSGRRSVKVYGASINPIDRKLPAGHARMLRS